MMMAYLPSYHKPEYPDTNYDMFPRPEDYQFPDHASRSVGHKGILPYEDFAIVEFMREMKIKFPWKTLITRASGKSFCEQCGAAYAGQADRCTARDVKVWHWTNKNYSYGGPEKKWGTPPSLGESAVNRGFSYQNCDRGWTRWDADADFHQQKRYFESIAETMRLLGRSGVSVQIGSAQIVSDHMPIVVAQQLQIAELEQKLQSLVRILQDHHAAFNQIASKMNQAGNALQF